MSRPIANFWQLMGFISELTEREDPPAIHLVCRGQREENGEFRWQDLYVEFRSGSLNPPQIVVENLAPGNYIRPRDLRRD